VLGTNDIHAENGEVGGRRHHQREMQREQQSLNKKAYRGQAGDGFAYS
jgi:hypothetical protein